jgi:glycosyltransferase involved in cell wall biosynthesis
MGSIIHVVNSDFGNSHCFGIHSWNIAEGLENPGDLIVFARSNARKKNRGYDVRPIGLGRFAGRLLKAANLYVSRRIPNRKIENVKFTDDLRRSLQTMDPASISVIHSWNFTPDIIAAMKQRNPEIVAFASYTMGLGPSEVERHSEAPIIAAYDYLFAPSEYVRGTLVASGIPEERVIVAQYGVDPERFRPSPSPDFDGIFRVAFAGQICRRKGIPMLVEAWNELALPNAELNLYGRPDKGLIGLLGASRKNGVFVRGFVDTAVALPKNQLFVFPSSQEGSAKSVYEALACGLPVITTPNSGSVVRDGVEGFLIEPNDKEALKERIRFFYDERRRLGDFGREARRAGEYYTWKRHVATVIAAYRERKPVLLLKP